MRQVPPWPGSKPDDNRKDKDAIREKQGEDDPMKGKSDIVSEVGLVNLERDNLEYDFNETEGGGANET